MPTVTPPHTAPEPASSHRAAPVRAGDASRSAGPVQPPEVLLPSGGPADPDGTVPPEPAPKWSDRAFRGAVERFRAQLAPVCSRDALWSSYAREAAASTASWHDLTPLRVAYALRWLELAEATPDQPEPVVIAWADLFDAQPA